MAIYAFILQYTLKYIFGKSGLVFVVSGHEFLVSGLVIGVSGLVFGVSGLVKFGTVYLLGVCILVGCLYTCRM